MTIVRMVRIYRRDDIERNKEINETNDFEFTI